MLRHALWVTNFNLFHPMASHLRLNGHFETNEPNDPQVTLKYKGAKVPHIHCKSVTEFKISLRFALAPVALELQAILRQVHQLTPKWSWTLKGQGYMFELPPESQISLSFTLRPAIFELQAILRQVHSVTAKMTLNTKRSKVPHYVTTKSDSQISVSFVLRLVAHQIQTILRQVPQMTPKWHWTVNDQRYPIYILELPTTPKFHAVSLYGQLFLSYRPFSDRCTDWARNPLEP